MITVQDIKELLMVAGIVGIIVAIATGCCTLDENRKSREGLAKLAAAIRIQADYVVDGGLVDPVKLATGEDGSFDVELCIKHSKMLESFRQGSPAMALSLEQWAAGEVVTDPAITDVDHEARCEQD
jgi:hypothetical protein